MSRRDRILCVQCGAPFEGVGLKCRACRTGLVAAPGLFGQFGWIYRRLVFVAKDSVPPATWVVGPVLLAMIYILTRAGCGKLGPEDFRLPPGIMVPKTPDQRTLQMPRGWSKGGVTYTARAEYELSARVLFALRVSADEAGEIAPFDLSVAWGQMSDSRLLKKVQFSHAGRFLGWGYSDPELFGLDIGLYLANMHLIPADQQVESTLRGLRTDSIVHLRGYLVDVRSDRLSFTSSLTRDDTGPGACEVMWVEFAKLVGTEER